MKAIIIAFTLKFQSELQIIKKLHRIKIENPEAVLIHGFMDKSTVIRSGFSTTLIDALHEYFPWQFNFYNRDYETPVFREQMANVGLTLGAKVYVIGESAFGVKDEINLYLKAGLEIEYVPL